LFASRTYGQYWQLKASYVMQSGRNKNSYHPYVLVAFYLSSLPENILSSIPRSTRSDWHHRDLNNSFGHAWAKENESEFETLKLVALNKELLAINKALLRVVAIKRFVETNALLTRAGCL
jgi:hypothetical protein